MVPVCVHAEHLHRHEDKHRHRCVHQCPILCVSLQVHERASFRLVICDASTSSPLNPWLPKQKPPMAKEALRTQAG